MSKHTLEPWHIGDMHGMQGCRSIRGPQRKDGLACTDGICPDEEDEANAQRIVSCVNAMAGIADPGNWIETAREIIYLASPKNDQVVDEFNAAVAKLIKAERGEWAR